MKAKNKPFHIMQYIVSSPDSPEIDDIPIRKRLSSGLDECPPDDRCLSWLIVLGIYSKNPADWPRKLHKLKDEYVGYISDLNLEDWIYEDLPISIADAQFHLSNNNIMLIIHSDIVRTGRQIFFLPPLSVAEPKTEEQKKDIYFLYSQHLRRMERILYTLAVLNPSVSYMQGFNELLQPLYNVLFQAKELFNNDLLVVECLAFNMLLALLLETDLVSFFKTQKTADHLIVMLSKFTDLLKEYNYKVYERLNELNIHPACYSFRWFCLMYSQEFTIPDIISLWDSILSHFDKVTEFCFCFGIGLLSQMEKQIMTGDFATVIEMLQKVTYPLIKPALKEANKIWKVKYSKNKK